MMILNKEPTMNNITKTYANLAEVNAELKNVLTNLREVKNGSQSDKQLSTRESINNFFENHKSVSLRSPVNDIAKFVRRALKLKKELETMSQDTSFLTNNVKTVKDTYLPDAPWLIERKSSSESSKKSKV